MPLLALPLAALALAGAGAAAPAGSADLRVTIADSPDPVTVGTPLGYAVEVQNAGPDAATGVAVTVALPKSVDFVSASSSGGPCKRKAQKVSCDLGTVGIPAGMYATAASVQLSVIPRQPGTIAATAAVSANQKDPGKANDTATATTRVLGTASCRGVAATIVGTAGDDALVGTGGRDVIAGLGGSDSIYSLAGRDLVCAGSGNDKVGGGSAADRVFAGSGADRLLGRGGSDVLKGSAGNDILRGNRGADRLRGGAGNDSCRGGAGADSVRGCER